MKHWYGAILLMCMGACMLRASYFHPYGHGSRRTTREITELTRNRPRSSRVRPGTPHIIRPDRFGEIPLPQQPEHVVRPVALRAVELAAPLVSIPSWLELAADAAADEMTAAVTPATMAAPIAQSMLASTSTLPFLPVPTPSIYSSDSDEELAALAYDERNEEVGDDDLIP